MQMLQKSFQQRPWSTRVLSHLDRLFSFRRHLMRMVSGPDSAILAISGQAEPWLVRRTPR